MNHSAYARIVAFDWFRAAAVLLVLGRHRDMHPLWHQIGWIGVDCFFVLSGFLVSQLLFSEYRNTRQIRVGRFLLRRGFKIYPGFLVLLAASSLYFTFRKGELPLDRFLPEALFLQNYFEGLNHHTWSLAVEEHFYFALAFGIAAVARRTRWLERDSSVLAVVLLAAIIFVAGARCVSALAYDFYAPLHFSGTHARIDGLLLGVLLSYFYCFQRELFVETVRSKRVALLIVSSVLLIPAFVWRVDHPIMYSVGYSCLYLGFGGLLACASVGTPSVTAGSTRIGRLAAGLGEHSYSIYLWHVPMATWGMGLLQKISPVDLRGGAWGDVVYLVGSLALGTLMARLIERPLLRLRDVWFPSSRDELQRGSAAVAASRMVA